VHWGSEAGRAKYIQHEPSVYTCFLDASKASDLVRHDILLQVLLSRSLPLWWCSFFTHGMPLRTSGSAEVGSVSSIFFSIKVVFCPLSSLLYTWMNYWSRLCSSGVGFYWGHYFIGVLMSADDTVLPAPYASALRVLLSICESFASTWLVL